MVRGIKCIKNVCVQHGVAEFVFAEFQHGFSVTVYKAEKVNGVSGGVNALLTYIQSHLEPQAHEMATVFNFSL